MFEGYRLCSRQQHRRIIHDVWPACSTSHAQPNITTDKHTSQHCSMHLLFLTLFPTRSRGPVWSPEPLILRKPPWQTEAPRTDPHCTAEWYCTPDASQQELKRTCLSCTRLALLPLTSLSKALHQGSLDLWPSPICNHYNCHPHTTHLSSTPTARPHTAHDPSTPPCC